jgi:hypothetical protein
MNDSEPQRETQVLTELNNLSGAVDQNKKLAMTLNERLKGVLIDDGKENDMVAEIKKPLVPIADRISLAAGVLHYSNQQLRSILDRLEV